jgi:hypothetical protein
MSRRKEGNASDQPVEQSNGNSQPSLESSSSPDTPSSAGDAANKWVKQFGSCYSRPEAAGDR